MMFPAPSSPVLAALEGIVVAAALLALGYLVADAVMGRRSADTVTTWGLAFPALVLFVLMLMLAHMATGGAVLSNAWLTQGVTIGVAASLGVRKWMDRYRSRRPASDIKLEVLVLAALVLLGLILWCTPAARKLGLVVVVDNKRDMGWASQLLNGESTPTGAVTGSIPNYYPWLFHALLAFVARFTPGGRAFHAQAPMQLLLVTATVSSLFALGRQVTGRWTTGACAALFGGLTGGLGFLLAGAPDVVNPRAGELASTYLGDMVAIRSPSMAFQNLAPPFARDVTFALIPAFLMLLVISVSRRDTKAAVAGGIVLGLVGLTGAETFFVGLAVAVLVGLSAGAFGRARACAAILLPALGLWAIWVVPLAINYLRLGGFFDFSARPIAYGGGEILVSWGILVPAAVYGTVLWLPRIRSDIRARVVFATPIVTVATLASPVFARSFLQGPLATLRYQHRYWPLLCLAAALLASLGLSEWLDRLIRVRPALAAAAGGIVLALAVPSPLLASLALPSQTGNPPGLSSSLEGNPRTLLNVLSPSPGHPCTAAVPGWQSKDVFSYTGYRLVLFKWHSRLSKNSAHIRWRSIYRLIPTMQERAADNRILTSGLGNPRRWKRLARKYGVDLVVAPYNRATAEAFRSYPLQPASEAGRRFVVVRVQPCTDH